MSDSTGGQYGGSGGIRCYGGFLGGLQSSYGGYGGLQSSSKDWMVKEVVSELVVGLPCID